MTGDSVQSRHTFVAERTNKQTNKKKYNYEYNKE